MRPIAPMLATLGRLPPEAEDERFGYEVKWDGVRAIGYLGKDRFQLLSRDERDIAAAYPELTPASAHAKRIAGPDDLVVDGEIVAFDAAGKPSFAALQQRIHVRDGARIARLRERTPVAYVVFDVLHRDGRSLIDLPYRERRATSYSNSARRPVPEPGGQASVRLSGARRKVNSTLRHGPGRSRPSGPGPWRSANSTISGSLTPNTVSESR